MKNKVDHIALTIEQIAKVINDMKEMDNQTAYSIGILSGVVAVKKLISGQVINAKCENVVFENDITELLQKLEIENYEELLIGLINHGIDVYDNLNDRIS